MGLVHHLLLFCCLCKNILSQPSNNENLIVETSTGLVQGTNDQTVGLQNPYYKFLGIPYAEPPIGNLRFEAPVPKSSWSGVLDCRNYRSKCVQGNPATGSEDCLFINIFTPKAPGSNSAKLPVIVSIHGGGFMEGSGDVSETRPDYFLDENIVFVTLQYRLGFFGFCSTGDMVAPGNSGLKDQIMALHWIKTNIANFGGDINNINLMGQSAGSVSISYLIQSKLSAGLYHKAIMESGVSLCLWGLHRDSLEMAKAVAKDSGVSFTDTRSLVDGLKTVDYNTLQTKFSGAVVSKVLGSNVLDGKLIAPVIEPNHEGAVISGNSHELLKTGQFNNVSIVIGHNSLESPIDMGGPFKMYLLKYDADPSGLTPIDMKASDRKKVGKEIKSRYFSWSFISLSELKTLTFISDHMFVRPVQEFAKLWSQHMPTYYYMFSHQGSLMGIENRTYSGVGHSEELGYIFHTKYEGSALDKVVRQRMVSLWSNFVKTGNPTPTKDQLLGNVIWPKTSSGDSNIKYLEIGDHLEVKQNYREADMKFWHDLYQKNGHPPYDTY